MRTVSWAAALVACLALTSSAKAQRSYVPFGGLDPRAVTNVPVDTSTSAAPIAQPQFFNRTFSLANFLPNISSFSAKPLMGQSTFPTASGMPGKNYLKQFGFSRAQPIR